MPRNGSGTYTLPIAAFAPNTTIISGDMNADLSDIGEAITESLGTAGGAEMTGQLRLYAGGGASEPSLTFVGAEGTGFYRNTVNGEIGIAIASASALVVDTSGNVTAQHDYIINNLAFIGNTITFTSGIYPRDGSSPITIFDGDLTCINGLGVDSTIAPHTIDLVVGQIFFFPNIGIGNYIILDDIELAYLRYRYDPGELSFQWHNGANDIVYFYTTAGFGGGYENNMYLGTYANIVARASVPTAPTPGSDRIRVYSKDRTDGTCLYYVDDNNRETACGPGTWELIATFTLTTSVASVGFNLSKTYSRLILNGVSLSPSSTVRGSYTVNVSDDGGSNFGTTDGAVVGRLIGTDIDGDNSDGAVLFDDMDAGDDDGNFTVDIMNTGESNVTKQAFGRGQSSDAIAQFNTIQQITGVDIVNYIALRTTGFNILTGKLVLYGMRAL